VKIDGPEISGCRVGIRCKTSVNFETHVSLFISFVFELLCWKISTEMSDNAAVLKAHIVSDEQPVALLVHFLLASHCSCINSIFR
jgi:hypothetical protein